MNRRFCLVSLVLSVGLMIPFQAHAAGRLRAGDAPPDSYRRSLRSRAPKAPMVATPVYRTPAVPDAEIAAIEPREQAGVRRYLIVVNDDLYEDIDDVLATYIDDVEAEGRTIELIQLGTSTPEGLRNLLISKHDEPDSLEGCYFIGDLPAAFFRHDDGDGATFPCELFFMDMDGTWIDTNADGYVDEHGAGSGDEGPEIYCGRTVAHELNLESGQDEVSLIRRYLGKVHDYRLGLITGTGQACIYTDDDWVYWHGDYCMNCAFAWYYIDGYSEPSETVASDYKVKLQGPYEFMRLGCHSGSYSHSFKINGEWGGGSVTSNDLVTNPPSHLLFYNLYACSNARWTATNCMGVWYTMNSGPGLGAWGSAKSGGVNNGEVFYQRVGEYHCFGYAVQDWFDDFAPYDVEEIGWTFGMLWLGDPTLWRSRVEPAEFSLSSPSDGAEHPLPDVWLSWQASEPAGVDETVTYTLIIDNDDDFSSPELVVEDIADTTYHLTSADGLWGIWQYWKVIATTNFDKSIECDEPRTFSIAFDVDLDGMGDAWESANGLNPSDPTDALHDSDGDWLLNREEHDLNSDPQGAQSPTWIHVDDNNAGDPAQDGSAAHPYEAIQTAIDAATAPAVVKVLPGTYSEPIVMTAGVWVVGAGPECTAIDAGNAAEGASLTGTENVLLAGFAITSGGGDYNGIWIEDCSPTIRNCMITASKHGVGCANSGSPLLLNCLIAGNLNVGYWQTGSVAATITNCTVADNATYGIVPWWGSVTMTNVIVYGNGDDIGGDPARFTATYCNVGDGDFAGSDGNISADPLFVSGPLHAHYLSQLAAGQGADSPCVDAGDPVTPVGLDRQTTRTDSTRDTGTIDMGYHAAYALRVTSISHGSDVTIEWNAQPNLDYVVEWSLDRETWHDVDVGQTGSWTDTDTAAYERKFYRIREK